MLRGQAEKLRCSAAQKDGISPQNRMIEVTKHGVILKKTDLGFENAGVLNPAVFCEGDTVHLFYRAVRKGNYSTIGYCRLEGPFTVVERFDVPVLFPQADFESKGVEDPRISKIDGLYYLTYTAYDGLNALGAYAVAETLPHFEKKGVLTPVIPYADFRRLAESKSPLNEKYLRYNGHSALHDDSDKKALLWDKNVVFFPRRIGGKLCFLHRIKPDIQIAAVRDLDELTASFWEDYFLHFQDHIVLEPKHRHEISYLGAGCPPIETEHGWLILYHGVHDTAAGYKYVACAALLDLENPAKAIARLPQALFSPEHDYEINGEVNNVCFPTGTALFGDTLYIYYGAADEQIACASLHLSALMSALLAQTAA
jgi:beta-1,2-mannobiose phosphorylase / 1,2-beta-oligomannan phosphorylase